MNFKNWTKKITLNKAVIGSEIKTVIKTQPRKTQDLMDSLYNPTRTLGKIQHQYSLNFSMNLKGMEHKKTHSWRQALFWYQTPHKNLTKRKWQAILLNDCRWKNPQGLSKQNVSNHSCIMTKLTSFQGFNMRNSINIIQHINRNKNKNHLRCRKKLWQGLGI